MIHLVYLGEGPRDKAVIPAIVKTLLNVPEGIPVKHEFAIWKDVRLNKPGLGSGFGRKLLFKIIEAYNSGADGIIAVVDVDNSPKREKLGALKTGRDKHREKNPPFPTALAEANPHVEAWLLDDKTAVLKTLGLADTNQIPMVGKIDHPKNFLHDLVGKSDRRDDKEIDIIQEIAVAIDLRRCHHTSDTGLRSLVDDMDAEIRPLIAKKS